MGAGSSKYLTFGMFEALIARPPKCVERTGFYVAVGQMQFWPPLSSLASQNPSHLPETQQSVITSWTEAGVGIDHRGLSVSRPH